MAPLETDPDDAPGAAPDEAPDAAQSGQARSGRARSVQTRSGTPLSEAGLSEAALSSVQRLSLPARMEAILYLKGRPLTLGELAQLAGVEPDAAELALITLMADYAHRDTALEIQQEGQHYGLQLREGLADLVQDLLPVDLSTACLRTLATIALKKRILQSELVDLRGSGAYDHIKELLAQDFIERRRQSDGRSYWLSLSEKFHRTFSVQATTPKLRNRGSGAPAATGSAAAPPASAADNHDGMEGNPAA